MKKEWIKYVVLGAVVIIVLGFLYIKYGPSGLFINVLVGLGAKYVTWARVQKVWNFIDKIMTGLFTKAEG